MKVRIIADLCQGHGMCALACSAIFSLSDEDGHAFVLDEQVHPGLTDAVDQAMRSCPEGAIAVDL